MTATCKRLNWISLLTTTSRLYLNFLYLIQFDCAMYMKFIWPWQRQQHQQQKRTAKNILLRWQNNKKICVLHEFWNYNWYCVVLGRMKNENGRWLFCKFNHLTLSIYLFATLYVCAALLSMEQNMYKILCCIFNKRSPSKGLKETE